jgi:hypothetical protein
MSVHKTSYISDAWIDIATQARRRWRLLSRDPADFLLILLRRSAIFATAK